MRKDYLPTALLLLFLLVPLSACKEEVKKAPEPVKVVFNPQSARDKINKRITTGDVDATETAAPSDYIKLIAISEDHKPDPSGFLSAIPSDDTRAIVLLAHISNGPELQLPTVPLVIFEKSATKWKTVFQARGSLTPLFVAKRAPLTISLEMVLLKDTLKDLPEDAQKIIQAFNIPKTIYSTERATEISTLSDDFAQRIALVEEATLKDIATFDISYLQSYASAIKLLQATGEVALTSILSIDGQKSVLPLHHNMPPAYNDLLSYKLGKMSPRMALGDLESVFWSVPSDALLASCQAVQGALKERLGLSQRDRAIILWRMMQPHAIYAEDINYVTQCSGDNMAAMLRESGFQVPTKETPRPSNSTTNAMNKSLSTIATLIKNTKQDNQTRISTLMDKTVLVRDEARLLFSAQPDQLITTLHDVIAPTMANEEASEYLMMLPIKTYGCYSQGNGQIGNHRATLIDMENDPNLWQLDFSFNKENKINAIQLKHPTQLDFCRAIGGRKGNNKCAFSGKNFPGLSADRCG
jgi:hypothetical protein